jgi:hypothetical protein
MQPLNDNELSRLLREWEAPPTPPGIEMRVLAAAEPAGFRRFLRWTVSGSIRVPVPVGIVAAILILFLTFQAVRPPEPVEADLSQFQPVKELKPRIIRSSYEAN